jgi:UDP-2,4-diacetamido-2,4,6-trideoxy-beta-L-altropyranose hydrolase
MRMIALGQAWQDQGGLVLFLCAEIAPALEARLQKERFSVQRIHAISGSREDLSATVSLISGNTSAHLAVALDGYQFNADFQSGLKKTGGRLLVLDDYGHADFYNADMVLNQNISAREELYIHRAPRTKLLLGTKFALLRREFLEHVGAKRHIPKIASKVLVTLGGADADNVTGGVIEALASLPLELKIVVGGSNPHLAALQCNVEKLQEARSRIDLIVNPASMPELMKWADLAVAAGGSTAWELAFMGVPSLYFILAENQYGIAMDLEEKGLGICLHGPAHEPDFLSLANEVSKLSTNFQMRQQFSMNCRRAVDGYGSGRVVEILMRKL